MKPIVLDTDVVSFLFKADCRAQPYLSHPDNRQWFISFMTEAELEQWAPGELERKARRVAEIVSEPLCDRSFIA